MNTIKLHTALPFVFQDHGLEIQSDIWLQNVNFERGYNYLIEANSGTGKSSLCSYIYGYRSDYSGEILFDGLNTRMLKSVQWDKIHCTELSYLFQDLRLFPELTAIENVILKNRLTNFKTINQINDLFACLGIESKKDVLVSNLSWGQQQRVAIIRCLCQPFDFLLLDEPISHLDDLNASIIATLLQTERSVRGATIISTSIGKHLPLDYDKTYSL